MTRGQFFDVENIPRLPSGDGPRVRARLVPGALATPGGEEGRRTRDAVGHSDRRLVSVAHIGHGKEPLGVKDEDSPAACPRACRASWRPPPSSRKRCNSQSPEAPRDCERQARAHTRQLQSRPRRMRTQSDSDRELVGLLASARVARRARWSASARSPRGPSLTRP